MLRTGLVIDRRYHDHDAGPGHPERAERIAVLESALGAQPRRELHPVEPRFADRDDLELVHTSGHIDRVEAPSGRPFFAFDPDTRVSAASYRTALLAVGGTLALVDAVMAGEVDNGFAVVRPPGHHAGPDNAMGFCLFNNIAIAARHLVRRHGLERVAIVDLDVHHGNGTQAVFAADPSVLYASIHQYPYYPGTGALHDVGHGAGEGLTVNLPLPAGCGDAEHLLLLERIVEPICRLFDPLFVLVSIGFDGHRRDPLAGMEMTEHGYVLLARGVLRVARDCCGGRLVAVLEGGYSAPALVASTLAVLDELGGERLSEDLPRIEAPHGALDAVLSVHGRYWDLATT